MLTSLVLRRETATRSAKYPVLDLPMAQIRDPLTPTIIGCVALCVVAGNSGEAAGRPAVASLAECAILAGEVACQKVSSRLGCSGGRKFR